MLSFANKNLFYEIENKKNTLYKSNVERFKSLLIFFDEVVVINYLNTIFVQNNHKT